MQTIAERHSYIIEKLNQQGFININDLANELGVTRVTVRNDFKMLESQGLLYRLRGGARKTNPHVPDLRVSVKDTINIDKKRSIARSAVNMIKDDDSIIIGCGSTIFAFAEEIRSRQWSHLNIVTPFLRLGLLFSEMDKIDVMQLGGMVHRKALSVLGDDALASLDNCFCSKAFVGADGIDIKNGITTSTIEEAKLTRKMMNVASKTILLADSSKFGQRGFGCICPLEDVDLIVTDDGIDSQTIDALEEAGVDFIIADQTTVTALQVAAKE